MESSLVPLFTGTKVEFVLSKIKRTIFMAYLGLFGVGEGVELLELCFVVESSDQSHKSQILCVFSAFRKDATPKTSKSNLALGFGKGKKKKKKKRKLKAT